MELKDFMDLSKLQKIQDAFPMRQDLLQLRLVKTASTSRKAAISHISV